VSGALRVIGPGLSTTVQDRGRIGYQRQGIPVSGALDPVALAAANVVVGNAPDSAAFECLYQGPLVEVQAPAARFAVAGAGAALDVVLPGTEGKRRVPMLHTVTVPRGGRVQVVLPGPGISAYLAVAGGIDVPPVLGSRSTYVRAGLGGFSGRALRAGDLVPIAVGPPPEGPERRLPGVAFPLPQTVRVVPGPQDDHFTPEAIQIFLEAVYTVAPASDRMGLRLSGPKLTHTRGYNIISDGIAPGSIQVPGDGLPIILLADRQTTGGYPKIATVASADLAALGRIGPGAQVRFSRTTVEAAEELRRALEQEMAAWPARCEPAESVAVIDEAQLYSSNLVSGVTDGTASPP
jgi:biotin-dependent carboxylase-like uncharacterized protein